MVAPTTGHEPYPIQRVGRLEVLRSKTENIFGLDGGVDVVCSAYIYSLKIATCLLSP